MEKYNSLMSDLAQIWRWSAFHEIKISKCHLAVYSGPQFWRWSAFHKIKNFKCELANFLSQNFENFQEV